MAQIGIFTRGDDGAFTGTIRTLAINVKATIKPVVKDSERRSSACGSRSS
jgi:uncharacterized protein (DUF736 family)